MSQSQGGFESFAGALLRTVATGLTAGAVVLGGISLQRPTSAERPTRIQAQPTVVGEVAPKATLVGPDEVKVGELAVLDASKSSGDRFYWDADGDLPLVEFDRRAVISTAKAGVYRITLTAAGTIPNPDKEGSHLGVREVARHTLRVVSPAPIPVPTPVPVPVPPEPRPEPGPVPVPPAPLPRPKPEPLGKFEQLGLEYAKAMGKAYGSAAGLLAGQIEAGAKIPEAQKSFQDAWASGRTAEFKRLIAPSLSEIVPEGSEPKDVAAREAFAKAWREIGKGAAR